MALGFDTALVLLAPCVAVSHTALLQPLCAEETISPSPATRKEIRKKEKRLKPTSGTSRGPNRTFCSFLELYLWNLYEQLLLQASLQHYTCVYMCVHIQSGPQKMYTIWQQFGGFDSVWMPMVATSNTYIESKIQEHLSYQFCFCINTVVTIIE